VSSVNMMKLLGGQLWAWTDFQANDAR